MADRIILVATLALAAVYLYATQQIRMFAFGDPVGPRTFPQLLCLGLVLAAVLLLVEMRTARRLRPAAADKEPAADTSPLWVVGAAAVFTAAYLAVFVSLGYVLSTAIYLLVLTAYFNRGKWVANTLTSVIYCLASYLIFTRALGVSLPAGPLPF